MSKATGRAITYSRPSGREFARRWRSRGADDDFITVMRGIYLVCRLGMASRVTNELRDLIGREPTTVVDLSHGTVDIIREGAGPIDALM